MLKVLYHRAKFGGVRISPATGQSKTGQPKTLSFLFAYVSIMLVNDRICAHNFTLKAFDYGNDFDTVGYCYLYDMLSVDGDADATMETRIQIGWNKFRQLAHTHTHSHFMALLDFVRDYPDELAPERQNQKGGSGISWAICKYAP